MVIEVCFKSLVFYLNWIANEVEKNVLLMNSTYRCKLFPEFLLIFGDKVLGQACMFSIV